jgi:predicted AAA+ superfamily ATPase
MIKREIVPEITHWLGKEKILVLKGARQVGKTTLLKHLKSYLEKKRPNSKTVYLQADNPKNQQIFDSPASLELFLEQTSNFPNEYTFLMIDEFQVINQAGLFLKNIFDQYKDKLQLIVSGSSSLEITKNTEFLTGRAIEFDIERISFKEYFDYFHSAETKKIPLENISEIEIFYKTFKSRIDIILKEYLIFGGYPEVMTTPKIADKEIVLESIIKKYIEKDVTDFLKVENISAFNSLIKLLSHKTGNLINKHELSNTVNASFLTVNNYLDILTGTYIIDLVTPYFKNIRSEISKMPKSYLLDFGIRSFLLKSFTMDDIFDGNLIENFVYLALISQIKKDRIHFYRTTSGSEIDFVIENNQGKIDLCEVKYRPKATTPVTMKNIEERYQNLVARKIVITKETLKKEADTYFIPASIIPFVEL